MRFQVASSTGYLKTFGGHLFCYCPDAVRVDFYSGLNLNQDKAASRRQYTRYGKASQRCTGLNLIHYTFSGSLLGQHGGNELLGAVVGQFFGDGAAEGIGVFARGLGFFAQDDGAVGMADQAVQGE